MSTKQWSAVFVVCGVMLAMATAAPAQFNINDAFIAMESGTVGSHANPFPGPAGGTLTAGTSLTPSTPGVFTGPGDDQWRHADSFNNNANLDGYHYNNINIIPAVLVNKAATPLATNFGVTVGGEQIFMHPGQLSGNAFGQPASAAVLRYTVATSGDYLITGDFESLAGVSGTAAVDVLLNGSSILSVGSGSDATAFSESETLAAGDLLDFVVDDAGEVNGDSTGLRANVSLVPEPASLSLLASGGLALFRRRR